MAKNTINITNEMTITLSKVRAIIGRKLTNEEAIKEGLKLLDGFIEKSNKK